MPHPLDDLYVLGGMRVRRARAATVSLLTDTSAARMEDRGLTPADDPAALFKGLNQHIYQGA